LSPELDGMGLLFGIVTGALDGMGLLFGIVTGALDGMGLLFGRMFVSVFVLSGTGG